MAAKLPRAGAPIAGNLPASQEFYRFFASLDTGGDSTDSTARSDIAQIATDLGSPDGTVGNIPPLSLGKYPRLQVDYPLSFNGLLQNGFCEIGWQGTTDDVPETVTNEYFDIARSWMLA